jgi:hypothetical protein
MPSYAFGATGSRGGVPAPGAAGIGSVWAAGNSAVSTYVRAACWTWLSLGLLLELAAAGAGFVAAGGATIGSMVGKGESVAVAVAVSWKRMSTTFDTGPLPFHSATEAGAAPVDDVPGEVDAAALGAEVEPFCASAAICAALAASSAAWRASCAASSAEPLAAGALPADHFIVVPCDRAAPGAAAASAVIIPKIRQVRFDMLLGLLNS